MRLTPRGRVPALITAICVVATGCGSDTRGGQSHPPAAEPAVAPTTSTPPAGQVIPVGAQPEGVAVDPQTHVVAVAVHDPAALVLLDGLSGTELRRVPLPGTVRHLQTQTPGTILVPVEPANELLRIAVPDGQVRTRVSTGRSPHDAAATATGDIVVANEGGGSVSVARGSTVEHTFTGVAQPGGVATIGDTAGVIDVGLSTLTVYDTPARTETAKLPAGDGPTHLIADRHGRFVVVDTRGNALLIYETTPSVHQAQRVPLAGTPYGIAYDPTRDRLWLTLTARNELVALDLTVDPPKLLARWPTVRQPNTVAVDSATGRVFITGTTDGLLQYLDP